MTMTIWKYPLEITDSQSFVTPEVWNPIHIAYQDERLTLWAEVDADDEAVVERTVVIVGTGNRYDAQGLAHIGSALDPNRPLVWHVYTTNDVVSLKPTHQPVAVRKGSGLSNGS